MHPQSDELRDVLGAAVVTGVSRRSGIGFAVARRLLTAGNRVLVHSWAAADESPDPGGLEAVLAEPGQAGGPVAHVEADFGDPDSPVVSGSSRRRPADRLALPGRCRMGDGAGRQLGGRLSPPALT